jgi:hypothetical protein
MSPLNFGRLFFLSEIRRSVAERHQAKWTCCLLAALIFTAILSGCASIAPGHDPILVRHEQATQLLFITSDRFLRWEHANREKFPNIKPLADKLRANVPWVLQRARDAAKDYKKQRTEASKATLVMTLAGVESLLDEAQGAAVLINSYLPQQPPQPPGLP